MAKKTAATVLPIILRPSLDDEIMTTGCEARFGQSRKLFDEKGRCPFNDNLAGTSFAAGLRSK